MTLEELTRLKKQLISIHTPREGSDSSERCPGIALHRFQSTLPVRGVTSTQSDFKRERFISIHTPREGSDGRTLGFCAANSISIHTPREGSDNTVKETADVETMISIHTPREGSDGSHGIPLPDWLDFNPHSP